MEYIKSLIADDRIMKLPFYIELAGITYPDPGYEIKREKSDIYVLEYVMEGSGIVRVNDETFYPQAGDVYLLPKGAFHHYSASKKTPYKKIWINVDGDLCEHLIQVFGLSGKYLYKDINIGYLFEEFLSLCEQQDLDIADIYEQCTVIFFRILQKLSMHHKDIRDYNACALKAKKYCDNHIYRQITAADAAAHVCLSVSQLNRLFKKDFKTTVYAYILNNKINAAKSLLCGTAMSVGEIACLLKFTDEHYFSNIFKKKTGMTPNAFRQK